MKFDELQDQFESLYLMAALEGAGYNQALAARLLSVTETRVRNMMRRHKIVPKNGRGRPKGGDAVDFATAESKMLCYLVDHGSTFHELQKGE
jgi:hypothetical protein